MLELVLTQENQQGDALTSLTAALVIRKNEIVFQFVVDGLYDQHLKANTKILFQKFLKITSYQNDERSPCRFEILLNHESNIKWVKLLPLESGWFITTN